MRHRDHDNDVQVAGRSGQWAWAADARLGFLRSGTLCSRVGHLGLWYFGFWFLAVIPIATVPIATVFAQSLPVAPLAPGGAGTGDRLLTIDNRAIVVGPGSSSRWSVLCFLGTECPLAKLYGPRLQALANEFSERSVEFVGIFSNVQDAPEEIARYIADHGISFACVDDHDQALAKRYLATRTPEVVVVDALSEVVYRGRIDDQYEPGVARQEPRREDLRLAVAALVAGETPAIPRTPPVGCLIGRTPMRHSQGPPAVTFHGEIREILERHCIQCHRPSQIGPFALEDYSDVAAWGEMILEVIDQGRMPPWHAAPPHERFQGARVMTNREIETVRRWVADGMAEGQASQQQHEPRIWIDGWNLPREPDLILPMAQRPMSVPATGTVDYQYFVVDLGIKEDRWVQAAQVIPGNARVVHHAICFVRPPDGTPFRGVGWLGAYVPGQQPTVLPQGFARFLPAGSKLVFQMHYTPTGKAETDLTKVGIVFADPQEVNEEIITMIALNQSFEIPAGASRHPVHATLDRFPKGGKLFSVMPHMHYRGAQFAVDLLRGEKRERLLEVPRYDFNWQHDYRLKQPIELDDYDAFEFTAVFDNSAKNPWNPDPSATVTWGDQSWEEMAVAFFDVSRPRNREFADRELRPAGLGIKEVEERKVRIDDYIDEFFAAFDKDGDNWIYPRETPEVFARFGFSRFDHNGDGRIDREEVRRVAKSKVR